MTRVTFLVSGFKHNDGSVVAVMVSFSAEQSELLWHTFPVRIFRAGKQECSVNFELYSDDVRMRILAALKSFWPIQLGCSSLPPFPCLYQKQKR